MAGTPIVVGIDLGGTHMQVGAVDASNAVIGRSRRKTLPDEGPDAVIARIADAVQEAVRGAGRSLDEVSAIGVGAPGAIDLSRGVVLEAPNLRWNSVPLAERLSACLAGRPVVVDNDVNAAVLGENRFGAGGDARDVLGVWIGTGIGGGLILDGRLYHGSSGTAGEIGQTILFPGAPLGWRTLEQNCSRSHLADRLVRLIRANHASALAADAGKGEIGAGAIARAYAQGDELTRRVVDEAVELLAVSVANCVTLLGLPMVILGGGLSEELGQPFADRLASAMRPHVFPAALRACKVVVTRLADDAGLLGAAILARDQQV